jgi:4-hydroxy-tetrahydrodipicolinate synthase
MFKGCFVALVTPFRDGRIDHAALDDLVDHVLSGGVSGVVPCGTTGESPTLREEEHTEVIRAVVRRVRGRVPVIAGAGTNCTASTLASSQAALEAGADALMLVAPYYNRPSQRGLYEHFSFVAERVDAPIVLYNIPGRTGVEIAVDTVAHLHAEHANIVAVKHATGSLDGAGALARACDITILSGDDTLTWPLMAVGAKGVVSVVGNLLPGEMSAMVGAALKGDWDGACRMHGRLFPLMRDLMKLDTNPIPIKAALALRGLMAEEYRLPLCPMEPALREQLGLLLDQYGVREAARCTA